MRYLPTLDLWNPAIQDAVISGQIRLQVGQWIRCGSSRLSRFIKVTDNGTIWAIHPEGDIENPTIKMARWSKSVDLLYRKPKQCKEDRVSK